MLAFPSKYNQNRSGKKRNGSTYDEGSIAEINLEKKRVWNVYAKIYPN